MRLFLLVGLTCITFMDSREAFAQVGSVQAIVDSFYPESRATGVSISINDRPLKAAAAVTNKTEFLEIPFSIPLVKDNNEINVTVSGPFDATVLVVIRSATRKYGPRAGRQN